MTDPITDMLNQIRNAQVVQKTEVVLPYSNFKNEVLAVLAQENFISDSKKIMKGKAKLLKIGLKYENGLPAMEGFKKVSKPGQRIYIKAQEIKKIKGGYGKVIISTPKGLMTGIKAKKAKLGGEVLFEVW